MVKETKKSKWQRYSESHKVKFQGNDTIAMLVRALAPIVGVDVKKVAKAKLEKAVEKAILKYNPTILFIEHDDLFVERIANKVITLKKSS